MYYDCSCVQPPSSKLASVANSSNYWLTNQSVSFVTDTICSADGGSLCRLPVLLVLLFVASFTAFCVAVPTVQVLIRCVPQPCSSVALGINSIMFRLLGLIPGPIVAGAIYDANCFYWQQTRCHESTECIAYDKSAVKSTIMYLMIGVHAVEILLYVFARLTTHQLISADSTLTVSTNLGDARERRNVDHSQF